MAPRPSRSLLLLAAAVGVYICRPTDIIAQVDPEAVVKVGRFWEQPHKVRFTKGPVGFSSISQGKDQWHLTVSEDGDPNKAGVFATQDSEDGAAYGLEYDSAKSSFDIAEAAGLKLKRVAFSAATKPFDTSMSDWTLNIEGDKGRRFSATGDVKSVVYDGAFGVEVPVKDGVTVKYAFDAKRRQGSSPVPTWFRHSAGVRYASPMGDVKLRLHQPNPDYPGVAPVEYQASLDGKVTGSNLKGSPTYTLRAMRDNSEKAFYEAKLKLKGPTEGLHGGLTAAIKDGEPYVSAFGDYAAKKRFGNGIEVGADTKFTVSPPGQGESADAFDLQPVGLTASANLSEFLPSIAGAGSRVDLRARYKIGADRAYLSAKAKLNAQKLAGLQVDAETSLDDKGYVTGKLAMSGAAAGVAARYELVAPQYDDPRQALELLFPANLKRGGIRGFGRLLQKGRDDPRLQLGIQYDFDTQVAGNTVRLEGESAGLDSGSRLLGDNGLPWHDTRLKRIRNSAETIRKRVEGSDIQSSTWL